MTGKPGWSGVGAAGGLLADRMLGEPPASVHPVARFGQAMAHAEQWCWRDSRAAGAAYAGAGIGLGMLVGRLAGRSTVATAVATTVVVAGRSLAAEAEGIAAALDDGDLDRARSRLPALVGRDVDQLDEPGIARAVVESVAENTVDAVIAPGCWAALAGASGAFGYRAVNTLDAMVGHRSERYLQFGWASARLDDVANWIPARLTAILVAVVRPSAARRVLTALRYPPPHPSPNAAVSEAAFAAALGVELGGDVSYGGRVDRRVPFGGERPPAAADIHAAVRLSRDVTLALAALLAASSARRRK
jgi:adenosylcobinamide-phosphate synthase